MWPSASDESAVLGHFCACAEDSGLAQALSDYVDACLEDVLTENPRKPHGRCLRLQPQPQTSCKAAFAAAAAHGTTTSVADWLKRCMALVPVPLSRCNGNTLELMHDGEPRKNAEDDEDIVEVSKTLRWGLLECLLNAHNGPVVVVCALGQQSVGKSYQLNHLGGVFFDVAGGRCTDGIWLAARHITGKSGADTLVLIFLIAVLSWSRAPVEIHALLRPQL